MAWPNIIERRSKVKRLMIEGLPDRQIRRLCSVEFMCTEGAITADIHAINGNTAHVGASQSRRIRIRDEFTCQYCGVEKPSSGIVEHVVPFALGGVAKDYNLVFACQRCNTEKKRKVWIPDNLDIITHNHPEWRDRIVLMAKNN